MPIPFIVMGIAAGAASLGASIHGTVKSKKWQKKHNKALANCQQVESETQTLSDEFNQQAERLGRLRVDGLETLQMAAEFLKNAKVKNRDFDNLRAIPDETLDHWKELRHEALKSMGIGIGGIGASAGAGAATAAGMYTAAGIFGVASTGTRIATLSGAAAHSARLAWLGGGALSAGGAGMAGGITTLSLGATIVAAPIGIAAAAFSQWQAERTKQRVKAKLDEFAQYESKLRERAAVMQAGQLRMTELESSIANSQSALCRLLAQSNATNVEDAYQVYKLADALSQLLNQPILTEAQQEILQQ